MNLFESFYKEHFKAIFRFFYYNGCDRSTSEDLSSEVFFRIYKSYKDNYNKQVLWGIAKNIYKEYIRNKVKENEISGFDDEFYIEENDYYDEDFENKLLALKKEMYGLIETLNESVKKVIKLRFIEGLTIKEISEKENMPISTIKKYQKRGIDYLISKKESKSVYPLSFIL